MSVMTESALRGYVYTWLASVLSTLWVGDLSARPAGKVAFVWHFEPNSRLSTPILEGRMSADDRLGRDTVQPPINTTGHVGEQTVIGDREAMLYLHWFGPGALDGLKTIRNMSEDPLLRPNWLANNFIIVECLGIIDAHQYLDSMQEDGATMDLRLRYSENWTANPGIIEHANIRLEIDGAFLNTITI